MAYCRYSGPMLGLCLLVAALLPCESNAYALVRSYSPASTSRALGKNTNAVASVTIKRLRLSKSRQWPVSADLIFRPLGRHTQAGYVSVNVHSRLGNKPQRNSLAVMAAYRGTIRASTCRLTKNGYKDVVVVGALNRVSVSIVSITAGRPRVVYCKGGLVAAHPSRMQGRWILVEDLPASNRDLGAKAKAERYIGDGVYRRLLRWNGHNFAPVTPHCNR